MLSLFAVACSKFGASSLKAEVRATDVNTLISAAPLATAANKHDINPPAAISAMRFANDVWIMHPSHEINSAIRSPRRRGPVTWPAETPAWPEYRRKESRPAPVSEAP